MADSTVRDSMQIISALDERRKRAETKALDMSLNELADMYNSGELDVHFVNPEPVHFGSDKV